MVALGLTRHLLVLALLWALANAAAAQTALTPRRPHLPPLAEETIRAQVEDGAPLSGFGDLGNLGDLGGDALPPPPPGMTLPDSVPRRGTARTPAPAADDGHGHATGPAGAAANAAAAGAPPPPLTPPPPPPPDDPWAGMPPRSVVPLEALAAGAYYLQLGDAFASWDQWLPARNLYRASLQSDGSNARAQVRLARSLFRLGAAPEAALHAREGLRAMPEDPEAVRVYAGVNLGLGELQLAESSLRSLLRAEPRDADALRLLGSLLRQTGRLPEADGLLRSAVAFKPGDSDAWFELARLAVDRRQPAQAITYLRQVLDVRPTFLPAVSVLMDLLLRAGRPAEAIAVGQQALRAEPTNPDLLLGTARLLAETQQLDEAAKLFERALALNLPAATLPSVGFLAEYAMARGKYADAARYARAGLKVQPDALPLRNLLSGALLGQKDFRGAAEVTGALVGQQPTNPGLWMRWLELLVRAKDYDTAERAAAGAINQFRGHPQIVGAAVTLLLSAGRTARVTGLLADATRRWPELPELAFLYYSALRHTGHNQRADQLIEQLAQRWPNETLARREAGLAAFARADWSAARRYLLPLFAKQQIDPPAVAALGWSSQFVGAYEEAAEVFSALVDPKRPVALFDVARQFTLLDDQERAAGVYDELLRSGVGGYSALLGQARALANLGRLEAALPLFERVLAREPRDLLAVRGKVMAMAMLGQVDEARQFALEFGPTAPGQSMGYLLAGDLAAEHQAWNEAVEDYLAGVTAVPRSGLLQKRLGDAYLAAGAEPTLAATRYELAAQLDSRDWYARWRLADLAQRADQPALAARWWRSALPLAPAPDWSYRGWLDSLAGADGPAASLAAGVQYLGEPTAVGVGGQTLADFARHHHMLADLAATLDPVISGGRATAAQRDAYGLALLRGGRAAEAVTFYTKQAERDKLNGLWVRRLGQAYELSGQATQAREQYRRASQLGGTDLEALALLARVEAAQGEAAAALGRLQDTLEADPNDYPRLARLLLDYHQAGLLPRALTRLRGLLEGDEAADVKPLVPAAGSAAAWTALGYAYELAGQIGESQVIYRRVLDREPDNRYARAGMERYRALGERYLMRSGPGAQAFEPPTAADEATPEDPSPVLAPPVAAEGPAATPAPAEGGLGGRMLNPNRRFWR